MTTVDEVKSYLTQTFATELDAGDLPADIDLRATGILTSVGTVQLLAWCGRTYLIPINSIAIDPDHLSTPERIAHFIETNRTTSSV